MAKITLKPDLLGLDAKKLNMQITIIRQNRANLTKLLNKMESSWEGEAATALINQIRQMLDHSIKIEKMLTEYLDFINNINKTFVEFDNKLYAKIHSIF